MFIFVAFARTEPPDWCDIVDWHRRGVVKPPVSKSHTILHTLIAAGERRSNANLQSILDSFQRSPRQAAGTFGRCGVDRSIVLLLLAVLALLDRGSRAMGRRGRI